MNDKLMETRRDMFAIDIANLSGIGKNLLYEYEDIIIVHSDKKRTIDGKEHIFVRAERPSDNYNGFDFCEIILPENRFYLAFGFDDNELIFIRDYLEKRIEEIME